MFFSPAILDVCDSSTGCVWYSIAPLVVGGTIAYSVVFLSLHNKSKGPHVLVCTRLLVCTRWRDRRLAVIVWMYRPLVPLTARRF